MEIIIDSRENKLWDLCEVLITPNIAKLTNFLLPLGDIVIKQDDVNLLLIERKTLDDLAASIKDGRYAEQSHRLENCEFHNHNIIYLIEGNWTEYEKNNVNSPLLSAIISLNFFKGFTVHKTNNIRETTIYLSQLATKIKKELMKQKQPHYLNDSLISDEQEVVNYCRVHKNVKKNNITIDNIAQILLAQIPHVSSAIAIIVMNKFKTLKNLIVNLETNQYCLDDLVTETNGKTRKISKLSKSNIYKYLLQKKEDVDAENNAL